MQSVVFTDSQDHMQCVVISSETAPNKSYYFAEIERRTKVQGHHR